MHLQSVLLPSTWWWLLHRSTRTLPEALSGTAVKLSGIAAGWLSPSAHTGWSDLECWLRTMLNGGINIPPERAVQPVSLSVGFRLHYPPEESEAKLRHLCSSRPPVQQRKVARCDVIPVQIPFPASLLSAQHITKSSCFSPEFAAGDLTVIHQYPAFTNEGCKLLILQ